MGSELREGLYQELWSTIKVPVEHQLYSVTKQAAKEDVRIRDRIGSGTLGLVEKANECG